ncbi:hypothetical protein ACFLTD_05590, partial [Elusimicrobiota bacterium]
LLLKKNGYNVQPIYIMHPKLFKRFGKDRDYFSSRGIELVPFVYRGWCRMRMYPRAYTVNERNLITKYNPAATFYPFYFKGKICRAGMTNIRIGTDGIVFRCNGEGSILGDMAGETVLYEKPKPCNAQICYCDGFELVQDNKELRYRSNVTLRHLFLSMSKGRYDLKLFRYIRRMKCAVRDSMFNFIKKLGLFKKMAEFEK